MATQHPQRVPIGEVQTANGVLPVKITKEFARLIGEMQSQVVAVTAESAASTEYAVQIATLTTQVNALAAQVALLAADPVDVTDLERRVSELEQTPIGGL